jgi:hypothetical protein
VFNVGKLQIPIGQTIILPLLLIGLLGSSPLPARQRAETSGDQSPALIAGRDAIANYYSGSTPEQLQELSRAVAAGTAGSLADRIVDLSTRLGVTKTAVLTLLHVLDEEDVPLERLPQKLGEIANQYKKLQTQLAALNPQNALARRLAEQAETEIKAGRFEQAHQLLRQVTQAGIAAAQQARELRQKAKVAEDEQLIQAAAASSPEGDLSMTELHYLQAADLFKEAANLVLRGTALGSRRRWASISDRGRSPRSRPVRFAGRRRFPCRRPPPTILSLGASLIGPAVNLISGENDVSSDRRQPLAPSGATLRAPGVDRSSRPSKGPSVPSMQTCARVSLLNGRK